MLASAASVSDAILAIHIIAVVVAFGVTFAYPIFVLAGARLDPRAIPWFHQIQVLVSRQLIAPGLVIVLLAGIYLASDEHQWSHFYVQWGMAAVIVLGGLEGAVIIPTERRLADVASRDVKAAGDGEVTWSPEYRALLRRGAAVGGLLDLIVVLTVLFMALHLGA